MTVSQFFVLLTDPEESCLGRPPQVLAATKVMLDQGNFVLPFCDGQE